MPLYDYHCPACAHDFELLVRGGATPACPACGATTLERQISLPAPQGTTKGILQRARAQAAREGHFSNYSAADRAKAVRS